jgi:hypothetical protein
VSTDDPDRTRSMGAPGGLDAHHGHPAIDGFELIMGAPFPLYLEGGFGRVYRARTADAMLVAIKVPRPELQSAVVAEQWAQECALSRAFPAHEHVVRYLPRAIARWSDGRQTEALVMEWLEGARGLTRYANDRQLDKPARVRLLMQAVEGVAWMHSHGTPHCDLKSDNMLVIERLGRPVVKVTDFGGTRVAQRLDPRGTAYTPSRAAPEVMAGDPAAITPRADVYSLCKECAELVAGCATARDESRPTACDENLAVTLGLADRGLAAIVNRGTQVEPSARYANAAELLNALNEYRAPRIERFTRWLEQLVWPDAPSLGVQVLGRNVPAEGPRLRGIGRVAWVLLVLVVVATLGGFALSNQMVSSGLWPKLILQPETPTSLSRVLIVREKASDGLVQFAQRRGIAGVDASAPATKRLAWAEVVRRIAEGQPDAIVLDVVFVQTKDEALNRAITAAIADVANGPHRVPVVVGTLDYAPGSPERRDELPLVSGIADAGARWGCINLSDFRVCGHSIVVPHRPNSEPRLPLSVAAVAAVLGRAEGNGQSLPVRVDADAERLRFLSDTLSGVSPGFFSVLQGKDIDGVEKIDGIDSRDVVGIYPVGVPADAVFAPIDLDVLDLVSADGAWSDLAKLAPTSSAPRADADAGRAAVLGRTAADLRGRVVLLAAHRADDVVSIPAGTMQVDSARQVPGVWMHAAAVQSLLDGVDAPRTTWLGVLVIGAWLASMLVLSGLLVAWMFRAVGVPMPTLGGSWPVASCAPRATVRRWAVLSAGLAVAFVAAGVAVQVVGSAQGWALPYVTGLMFIGAATGAVLGAALACMAAWMGCVRRAWCLDRAA